MNKSRDEFEGAMELQAAEAVLVRALERRPQVTVPEGFAARVAWALPAEASLHQAPRAGKTVAMVAAVLLTVALFVLAPQAGPSFSNVRFEVELLVLTELGAVAWVLGRMQAGSL